MYTCNSDEPCERTEAQAAYLDRNRGAISRRALEIASQNPNSDGLIDAVINDIQCRSENLQKVVEFTMLSGAGCVLPVSFSGQLINTAREFFREQAEEELLREEGLL